MWGAYKIHLQIYVWNTPIDFHTMSTNNSCSNKNIYHFWQILVPCFCTLLTLLPTQFVGHFVNRGEDFSTSTLIVALSYNFHKYSNLRRNRKMSVFFSIRWHFLGLSTLWARTSIQYNVTIQCAAAVQYKMLVTDGTDEWYQDEPTSIQLFWHPPFTLLYLPVFSVTSHHNVFTTPINICQRNEEKIFK